MELNNTRARSPEKKQERFQQIMDVTNQLFLNHSYHDITLTTIAKELNWSRGNLYKYVNTKEEIFLELYLEKQNQFVEDLKQSFTLQQLDPKTFADKLSTIFNNNRIYLRYHSILSNIIETNVDVEKLADFKIRSFKQREFIFQLLQVQCPTFTTKQIKMLFLTLMYHACGLDSHTHSTKLLEEAMALANLPLYLDDYCDLMSEFILMCIEYKNPNS